MKIRLTLVLLLHSNGVRHFYSSWRKCWSQVTWIFSKEAYLLYVTAFQATLKWVKSFSSRWRDPWEGQADSGRPNLWVLRSSNASPGPDQAINLQLLKKRTQLNPSTKLWNLVSHWFWLPSPDSSTFHNRAALGIFCRQTHYWHLSQGCWGYRQGD